MKCYLCPRNCGIDRSNARGRCSVGNRIKIGRAALHHWEEPCISGERGSGAIFFSGCALHCIYCQNNNISDGSVGKEFTEEELVEIIFDLKEQGANNINLVTGDHFIPEISRIISKAKDKGLNLPIIFNCSGYETVETLKILDGLIDVYLPDFKYEETDIAKAFSSAKDYPDIAKLAIAEMIRQQPTCEFSENGMIEKGVIVRNLLLPGHVKNSKKVLKYLHETYGNSIYISIMSQYTPIGGIPKNYPELQRKVTLREYDRLINYAIDLGIENAFIQEMGTADESFIPSFDL